MYGSKHSEQLDPKLIPEGEKKEITETMEFLGNGYHVAEVHPEGSGGRVECWGHGKGGLSWGYGEEVHPEGWG